MKEITVLSGKGGTGKTSITAALASLFEKTVFCDNDVDAADLHLIFKPEVVENHNFEYGWDMHIDASVCKKCGICQTYCRFDAIGLDDQGVMDINGFRCEGCRLCEKVCSAKAISATPNCNNRWFISSTRFGSMVHAEMGVGEENSGKLVSLIRQKSRELAKEKGAHYILNDGPPGIGCATVASITGSDAVVVVIEPSVSGWHDAQRLMELVEQWGIPIYAVINKYDLHRPMTEKIVSYLEHHHIPLLAKVPWSKDFVTSMEQQQNIIEYDPTSEAAKAVKKVWTELK